MKELEFKSTKGKVLWKALLLEPKDTGLTTNVFAYPNQTKSSNQPFVKYQIDSNKPFNTGRYQSMSISHSPFCQQLFNSTEKDKVSNWIRLNRVLLIALWENRLSLDEFKSELKKIV